MKAQGNRVLTLLVAIVGLLAVTLGGPAQAEARDLSVTASDSLFEDVVRITYLSGVSQGEDGSLVIIKGKLLSLKYDRYI